MPERAPPLPDDFSRLLRTLCKGAADLLQAEAAAVYLKQDEEVVLRGAHGYSEALVDIARYKLGEGITGWIAEGNEFKANSREEIFGHKNHKAKYDTEIWSDGLRDCNSLVGLPLYIDGQVYGLIKVENKTVESCCDDFTETDLYHLRIFLGAIAEAIRANPELMSAIGRLYVFVLIPFNEKFINVYELGIRAAVESVGMQCEKVDEIEFNHDILEQIFQCIHRADIVISVMTDKNPNVFFETGYARALLKEIVHISDEEQDIPFDLGHYNHIRYKSNNLPVLKERLRTRLIKSREKLKENV